MLKMVYDNAYLAHGKKVKKLASGIPQGIPPGVFMASLHLFEYEDNWIDRAVKAGRIDLVIELIHKIRRLLDDIGAINVDNFKDYLYFTPDTPLGIYPSYYNIKLEQTTLNPIDIKFGKGITYLNGILKE